jgi:hypothetical protein
MILIVEGEGLTDIATPFGVVVVCFAYHMRDIPTAKESMPTPASADGEVGNPEVLYPLRPELRKGEA